MVDEGAGVWWFVRARNVNGFAVGHDAAALGYTELAVGERVGIDLERGDAPVGIAGGVEAKMQRVFEILFLQLKMLGREEHALRPNHTMPVLHECLELLPVGLENGGDIFTQGIADLADAVEIEHLGEAGSAR